MKLQRPEMKRFLITLLITFFTTFVPSCFEDMRALSDDRTELLLGFPFDFYTVKYTAAETFAVHFNIMGFAANIVSVYLVLTLCIWILNEIKERIR